jgi:hypothetical protein
LYDFKKHNARKISCVNIDKIKQLNTTNNNIEKINDSNISNILNFPIDDNIKELHNNDEHVLLNILGQMKNLNKQIYELTNKVKTLEESNIELKKNNIELNNKIIAITPTTQINVINNVNITIIPFGKENLNFISEEKCIKELIYAGFGCIQKYIDIVHFNKDKPEYHNMYIPNRKDLNQILINDGEKWNIAITDDIIEKMLDKMVIYTKTKHEKYNDENKLQETKTKGINRLFDKYDDDVNKLVKENRKDIKNNIYNNRNIVLYTNKIKK